MILNEINKQVIISFGLGITMLSCDVGDDVTIYVNGIYNQDECSIEQAEIVETITLVYKNIASPITEFTADFELVGQYNGRAYYENTTDLNGFFIIWKNEKWLLVTIFDLGTGNYNLLFGFMNENTPLPIGNTWVSNPVGVTPVSVFPRRTTSNIENCQGFTFPASTSKMIQIGMKNKTTGNVILSNKIELTVT